MVEKKETKVDGRCDEDIRVIVHFTFSLEEQ